MDTRCLKFYKEMEIDLLDVASSRAPTIKSLSCNSERIRVAQSAYEQRFNSSIAFYDPKTVIRAGQLSYFISNEIWKTEFIKRINLENGTDHKMKILTECFDKHHDPVPVLFTGKIIDNNFLGYCRYATSSPTKREWLLGCRPWHSRYLIEVLIYNKLFYVLNRSLFFLLAKNTYELSYYSDRPSFEFEYKKHVSQLNQIVFCQK